MSGMSNRLREIRVLIEYDDNPRLSGIHGLLRDFLREQGATVVRTTTGAVCRTCRGDGKVESSRRGCIVLKDRDCADCGGKGY